MIGPPPHISPQDWVVQVELEAQAPVLADTDAEFRKLRPLFEDLAAAVADAFRQGKLKLEPSLDSSSSSSRGGGGGGADDGDADAVTMTGIVRSDAHTRTGILKLEKAEQQFDEVWEVFYAQYVHAAQTGARQVPETKQILALLAVSFCARRLLAFATSHAWAVRELMETERPVLFY